MAVGLAGFLQGISGQLDPIRQAQVAQARQQIADLKTASEASQLAGLFGLSGAQPQPAAPAPQPAPAPRPIAAPQSAPAMAPAAAATPVAARAPGPKAAPRATQMMSPATGALVPLDQAAAAPQAPTAAQPQQDQQFNGFASPQNFNDVLGATQGALQEIQSKIAQQYRSVHGTDPDPGVLMKATDMVISQMHQLSPDVTAGLRINAMQQHNDYLQQSLDERSRQFDANQERLQQAEQDKIALAKQNQDLKMEIAKMVDARSAANTAARTGATIQAANIRASSSQQGRSDTASRVASSNNLRSALADLSSATRIYQSTMNNYSASDADKAAAKKDYINAKARVSALQGGGAAPAAAKPSVSNW